MRFEGATQLASFLAPGALLCFQHNISHWRLMQDKRDSYLIRNMASELEGWIITQSVTELERLKRISHIIHDYMTLNAAIDAA